jgi:glycosyltransferase involved in cell wall biosynthesis
MPRVSVLMPMKNAEAYVKEAIGSILAVQSIPLELIVVNDGSTDKSNEIVSDMKDDRIRLLQNHGRGHPEAINTALNEAKGEFVINIDSDDICPPNRMEIQIDWLSRHHEFGAVCGSYKAINSKGGLIRNYACGDTEEEITQEIKTGKLRTTFCSYMIRTDIFRSIKGARPFFICCCDLDIQYRLSEICRIYYLPQIFYSYRLHDESITHSINNLIREFYHETSRVFQEQRKVQGQDDLERGVPPEPPYDLKSKPQKSKDHEIDLLVGAAWNLFEQRKKYQAIKTFLKALIMSPLRIYLWRSFMAILFKPSPKQIG